VHFGNFVGVTKSFAGSSPSKGGDHGPAQIVVRPRQHTEIYARLPTSALEKNAVIPQNYVLKESIASSAFPKNRQRTLLMPHFSQ
jgi:hypothetical protein